MGTKWGYDDNDNPLKGRELLDLARQERGDTVLLSFSGKDSLACWLYLLENDFKVIPYHLDQIPGLSWVNQNIAYYEQYFGQHIIRLPHPHFWQYLNEFHYQPPDRVAKIRTLDFPDYDFYQIEDLICQVRDIPKPWPFAAIGMRSADSLARMRMIQQMGALSTGQRRFFYPIWDWKLDDLAAYLNRFDVKLPIDYHYWGNTTTTWIYRYMKPLRDNFPEDWERIKQWFPLIELELFRYEVVNATAQDRIHQATN